MMVTGTVVAGISIAPVLQEQENDDENEDRGLVQGLVHLVDGLFDEPRGVERDAGDQPLGELARQHRHLAAYLVRDVERVRARRLEDRRPAAGLPSSVNTWP